MKPFEVKHTPPLHLYIVTDYWSFQAEMDNSRRGGRKGETSVDESHLIIDRQEKYNVGVELIIFHIQFPIIIYNLH